MENRPLFGLDIIRFAAALLVAWFHLAYFNWAGRATSAPLMAGAVFFPDIAPLASFGWVGVHIFFVLSGFVIAYSAENKTASQFAKSRFLRLYPAVWICATISLLVLSMSRKDLADEFIRSIFLWPFGPWVDGVYWTLGIEMAFYGLVWFLLLVRMPLKMPALLAAVGIPSCIFWSIWFFDHLAGGSRLFWTFGHRYFELTLLQHGCFFTLGGMLWLISLKSATSLRWLLTGWALGSGLICIYATAHYKVLAGQGHSPAVPMLLWLLAVGSIVISVVFKGRVSPVAGVVIRTLGLATYPLYLLHNVVRQALMRHFVIIGVPQAVALVAALVGVVALSILVLIPEKPLRRASNLAWESAMRRAEILKLKLHRRGRSQ